MKPKKTLSDWEAEEYNRYLQTVDQPRKKKEIDDGLDTLDGLYWIKKKQLLEEEE